MRIVAGALRGRSLVAPKGHSTRPTADRARQALFNVLEHAPWSPGLAGLQTLDLFAGSGALGLEALSRGAACCLFADTDPAAGAALAANIAALGLADRCAVRRWDATRLPGRPPAPFDLAFLDPPYGAGVVEPALARLSTGGWLAAGAMLVVERGAAEPALALPGFAIQDSRAWGAARVWFLRFRTEA
jgi:16S rRNA (guanine966-N2)-methyltransferase